MARAYPARPGAGLSRRDWFKWGATGVVSLSMTGWLGALAAAAAGNPQRKRSCILLWMRGGPSQIDTFDPKPGHPNGGPFKPMQTIVPGIQISEHLPQLARQAEHLALVRSMTSKEGDHGRATYLVRTGYLPQPTVEHPPLGALVAKELGDEAAELPNFVSIAPNRLDDPRAFAGGFLGPRHAPLVVGENGFGRIGQTPAAIDEALKVHDLALSAGTSQARADGRLALLRQVRQDFQAGHPDSAVASHQSAYERAARLMRPAAASAFDLSTEKPAVREAYGWSLFGQGCLLARRLVERQVPFVEVTLDGWDTHSDNANAVRRLSQTLDAGWSALMTDLKERGLLDTTLVAWMGEFGRTPRIARGDGRDHWPNSFSAVLAGGGIRGGQVIGDTGRDGVEIKDRPVTVPEFLATMCEALGIDHQQQNLATAGRPIRIVAPGTQAVQEALLATK